MPRGRTSRAVAIRRAVSCIETLESRRMLTTLQGGDTFEYLDANNQVIRISLTGDIVAEFIAARVRPSNNSVVIRDLVPAPLPPPLGVPAPVIDGADLFHIYIVDASPDARITISEVTPATRLVTPYAGNVGDIQVGIPSFSGPILLSTPDGGGGVYLGARTKDITILPGTNEADIPIIYNSYRGDYGVRPGSKGIWAGIQTAPGVSMGRILIGGTITGRVFVDGNLETLYANDILTGDAAGLYSSTTPLVRNNIFIGGDLRNLLARGSIGTATDQPGYRTGVEIRVGGKLGNVRALEEFNASVFVVNNPDVQGIVGPFAEVEGGTTAALDDQDFMAGEITAPGMSNNLATSTQYASSSGSVVTGLTQSIDFSGGLDGVDNFSVPLVAGQKIVVQLFSEMEGNIGIFDPLDRLVATDYADIAGGGQNQAFQFTAELPGTYRFAVAIAGLSTFVSPGGSIGGMDYVLSISEYGEVALGGVHAGGNLALSGESIGVLVRTGDIGAISATGDVTGGELTPVQASRGNLRHLHGGNVNGVNLIVPRGTVGFVDSDGSLMINPNAVDDDGIVPGYAVGFDYQRVQADGDLLSNLVANRSIGTIIANSIPGNPQFVANADNRGSDGFIDLIDVTGDFGNIGFGGPGLYTGQGGNVKYIRVGGTVYRDPYFGSSVLTDVVVPPGQSINLTDDSGATGILTPTFTTEIVNGETIITPGQLTLTPYGVRESGGVVLINVESTLSVNVNVTNSVGSFDITELTTNGDGTAVIYDDERDVVEFEPPAPVDPDLPVPAIPNRIIETPNAITFSGRSPVNVMSITGGNLTNVTNNTQGEIASIDADTLGIFNAQSMGVIKSSTAARVMPNGNLPVAAYPYNDYSYGFNIAGPVFEVFSRESIGDFYSAAEIGMLRANSDGTNNPRLFEGINGVVRGRIIQRVEIGEGLASSGSGLVSGGGIYAQGGEDSYLGQIIGRNADIRGTIGSEGTIRDIVLLNGSIIGSFIGTPTDISLMSPLPSATIPTFIDFQELPEPGDPYVIDYSINTIRLNGNGGILGSLIMTGDFNAIDVRGGFGILSTAIISVAINNPNNIIATDGLGIRNSYVSAGTSLNAIQARGQGQLLDINQYSPSVLQSVGRRKFDSSTGRTLGGSNDLHKYLGTSKTNSAISGITNSGIIENLIATGALNLGKVEAFLIRDDAENPVHASSPRFPSRIAFANSIGSIKTVGAIAGLQVRTGKLDEINAGANIEDAQVSASGRIKTIASGRNIRGNATFEARGPDGQIDWLYAKLGIYGSVTATKNIGKMQVGTLGNTTQTLGKITDLLVSKDVLSGTYVRASQGITNLFVQGNIESGAKISAKSFGTTTILGTNNGEVVVE